MAEAGENQERQQGEAGTPRVAVNHLMALIRRNDMLSDELMSTGYKTTNKVLKSKEHTSMVTPW